MNTKRLLLALALGVFLIADRFFKWASLTVWDSPKMLSRFFGWNPFLNPGVAFGIPLPLPFMLLFGFVIISALVWWSFGHAHQKSSIERLATVAVIFGAASNLYDRVTMGVTVDYVQIVTGVFNIADFLIIVGFAILILNNRREAAAN